MTTFAYGCKEVDICHEQARLNAFKLFICFAKTNAIEAFYRSFLKRPYLVLFLLDQ